MSRTDVHRPYHVQQRDPYERHRWYRFAAWPDRVELVPTYPTHNCPACNRGEDAKAGRKRRYAARREINAQMLDM